jgi:hypothetical protein
MKSKPAPKRRRAKKAAQVFRFTTPGARPLLDLGEDAMIEKAVRAATRGGLK